MVGDGAGEATVGSDAAAGVRSLESRATGEDGLFKNTVSASSNVSDAGVFPSRFTPDASNSSFPDDGRASDDLDLPAAEYVGGSEAISTTWLEYAVQVILKLDHQNRGFMSEMKRSEGNLKQAESKQSG